MTIDLRLQLTIIGVQTLMKTHNEKLYNNAHNRK